MLVSKKHKKLVLNLKNPGRITAVIPTSKTLEYNGTKLVAVPHRLDEVRVLRNLGIDAPSPILYHYDWPGLYKPFEHQRATAAFLTTNPKAFCLNGMGTMKTMTSLWSFDFIRRQDQVDAAIVLAPLSTLEVTWGREIFKNMAEFNYTIVHGNADKCRKLLREDFDVYIANHHGLLNAEKLQELVALCKRKRILLVVDEIATFRNASTKLWKALKQLADVCQWTWGLTGTPTPNAPTDAWAQCRLINPTTVPKYFGAFRDMVMRQSGPFKWVARDNALDTVYRVMQPAIRYGREACLDLPPTTYVTRHVPLSAEQAKVYGELMSKFRAEYLGGQINAINEAAKRSKLLQVCAGVAYGSGDDVIIPAPDRVALLKEIIEQADAKVIIFVPFTGALQALAQEIGRDYSVSVIDGGVSNTKRGQIFADFRDPHGARVLVAQAAAMSHGLNLTVANTVVWYGPAQSNDIYEQANARVPRPGQKLNTFIIHIESSPVERKSYDNLQKKKTTQGILLDMFEGQDQTPA